MSIINKIPRVLRVLVVMLILAVLVWRFAFETGYFYYALGGAVLITALAIFLVYFSRKSDAAGTGEAVHVKKAARKAPQKEEEGEAVEARERAEDSPALSDEKPNTGPDANTDEENIPAEEDYTDVPTYQRKQGGGSSLRSPKGSFNRNLSGSYSSNATKPDAVDVAARYRQMASTIKDDNDSDFILPSVKAAASKDNQSPRDEDSPEEPGAETEMEDGAVDGASPAGDSGEPPVPMIEDESSLTPEDVNQLVNAVWYRCENPYCKYTSFLSVHHIVDEKEGGDNTLDNLIVLCPYCHGLAHSNEIPVEEMREWISDRETRFKFKPEWPYFKSRSGEGNEEK